MLLLGRAMFVIGFIGLAIQIFDVWLGLLGLPIDKEHLVFALLWWGGFGALAAGGVLIMKRNEEEEG